MSRASVSVEHDDDLAPRLREALGGPALAIPPETDAFLEDAARMAARRLSARRRRRVLLAAIPAAAAAALALFLTLRAPRDARDVNGDGRIDILDAFALARAIERGGALRPEWDFNGDHAIDRADVDLCAHRAVELRR
ncbi:MAG TPA: dockerin type I domain-containing protein [Haliangiales bacterium]|nr:dockerin type I domain-containing protein [Haliangiales bacterium]